MRASAALGLSLLLSGIRTVSAEPCAPRAKLDGDRPTVERVSIELRHLGIDVVDPTKPVTRPACPTLEANVASVPVAGADDGIAVAIRDRTRRTEGRVVSDAPLAAAWIDSWLRDDNAPQELEQLAPPSAAEVHAAPPIVVAPTPSILDRLTVAATYERSTSDDTAGWNGGSAMACLRIGNDLCVGGRIRGAWTRADAATDQPITPDVNGELPSIDRADLSALAIASYSVHAGTTTISPEIGAGVGRLAIDRTIQLQCKDPPPPDPGCQPNDPTCSPTPANPPCDPTGAPKTTTTSTTSWTPRATAALRIAIPVFDHVWIDGTATFSVAPLGTAASKITDAAGFVHETPADPFTSYAFGIGLRIGAP